MKSVFPYVILCALVLMSSCKKDEEEEVSTPDPRDSYIGSWTITNAYWYYQYNYNTMDFDSGTNYTEYPGSTISKGSGADELVINLSGTGGGATVRFEAGDLFCMGGCLEDTYSPDADGWINEDQMEYYLGCVCGFSSSSNTWTGVRE